MSAFPIKSFPEHGRGLLPCCRPAARGDCTPRVEKQCSHPCGAASGKATLPPGTAKRVVIPNPHISSAEVRRFCCPISFPGKKHHGRLSVDGRAWLLSLVLHTGAKLLLRINRAKPVLYGAGLGPAPCASSRSMAGDCYPAAASRHRVTVPPCVSARGRSVLCRVSDFPGGKA